ncbi:MAG TPA: DUF4375 domain-containing protein [Dehalococcoidales bacterium]|nr:DUF4375 domain-containing protein [Dehalococcoidales bacterium]
MIKPAEIDRRQLEKDPHLLWKTFQKFLSKADTTEMDDVQMAAQLPYWYHADMQSGGHLQYFEEKYQKLGDKLDVLLLATLDALKIIRANRQAEILAAAADLYFSRPRRHTLDTDKLAQLSPAGEFQELDEEYRHCSPGIAELLEEYLTAHQDHFIKII